MPVRLGRGPPCLFRKAAAELRGGVIPCKHEKIVEGSHCAAQPTSGKTLVEAMKDVRPPGAELGSEEEPGQLGSISHPKSGQPVRTDSRLKSGFRMGGGRPSRISAE